MRHHVAGKNDGHEVAGIGKRHVARAEEAEHGIDEKHEHGSERYAERDVHDEHVAQDFLRRGVVALTEFHAHKRGGSHAHHGAERGGERHERTGQCQAHDGFGTYALPDEDAVHNVVDRRGRHGHDSGNGVLHEELAYGLFGKHIELVCLVLLFYVFVHIIAKLLHALRETKVSKRIYGIFCNLKHIADRN